MCLKLQRTYECETGNHHQEALIRCSDPITLPDDLELDGLSDQYCILMPSVVEEYYDGPCQDCRGDTEGLPARGTKLKMKRTWDPWYQIDPNIQDQDQDVLDLMKKERDHTGGPSIYYAHALASWIYYVMTMDREPDDTEVQSLPDYIKPDPERTPAENRRAIWAERWENMLPEASCRFNPEHGPLQGLECREEDNGNIVYEWGQLNCDCLGEQRPELNNPLSSVRRGAATSMLNNLAFRVFEEDQEYIGSLFGREMRFRERLAGFTEIFEKRKPAMKNYIQVVKPLTFQELQEQIAAHVNFFAPMMTHYCHNIKNYSTPWVRQLDDATYQIEARTCRERQYFVETLVINLVARDPGLSFLRQRNIINWFVKEFFAYNSRVQDRDIYAHDPNFFFRLQHMSMRDGLENQQRMRKWVNDAAFASERGIQLHAVYQNELLAWEGHKKEHESQVLFLELNIVDATEKDIARLDEASRACPVCGDDLKELLEMRPMTGRRKKYLVPAQPLTCWMNKNDHWFCRSCLLRCALVREGVEYGMRYVKPRCPLCRKNYNPHQNSVDEAERKQEEEQERERQAREAAVAAAQAALAGPPGPPGTPAPPTQPFQSPQPSPPRAPTLAQFEGQQMIPQAQASNMVPSPASQTIAQMPSVLQVQTGQEPVRFTEAVDSDHDMTDIGTTYASTEYDDNADQDPFFVQPAATDDRMDVDEEEEGESDVPMEYF